jgi:hypothetical protein
MTNGQPNAAQPGPQPPLFDQKAAPAAPPQKKSGALKWVIIGGCGCVFVVILFSAVIFGGVFWGLNKAKQTVEPTLNGHAQAIMSGDMDAAYAFCSEEFKTSTDRQQYEDFVNTYKVVLTAPDKSFNSFKMENNIMTVGGTVSTPDGQTYPVSYQLIKKGDQWLIYGIDIGNQ